jgi:hypothetical protein
MVSPPVRTAQAERNGSRGRALHLAKLASTCWTLSLGPLLTHTVAVTVKVSITNAMKRSRIISAPPSMVPIRQQQKSTVGSSQGYVSVDKTEAKLRAKHTGN